MNVKEIHYTISIDLTEKHWRVKMWTILTTVSRRSDLACAKLCFQRAKTSAYGVVHVKLLQGLVSTTQYLRKVSSNFAEASSVYITGRLQVIRATFLQAELRARKISCGHVRVERLP